MAVFPPEVGRGRDDPLLILHNGFHHLRRRSPRGVIGAPGFQISHNLRPPLARSLHQPLYRFLLHQFGQRKAPHRSVSRKGHHRIPVSPQHHRIHIRRPHIELLGNEAAETGGIQHPGHSHHLPEGEAAFTQSRHGDNIQGIGYRDNNRIRRPAAHRPGRGSRDSHIRFKQVHPVHTGLPGDTRGEHDHIRIRDRRIIVRSLNIPMESPGRRRVQEIQSLALGHPFHHIHHHHIGDILLRDTVHRRGTHITRTDNRYFGCFFHE